jgi:high-affinity K+ transport system ATPase subunit B
MIDDHVVALALKYLDYCFEKDKEATLVGMLNEVDYRDRVILNKDEVNKALKQRPSAYVQRMNAKVIFVSSDGDRTITAEDLEKGIEDYRNWFAAELKNLEIRKRAPKQ